MYIVVEIAYTREFASDINHAQDHQLAEDLLIFDVDGNVLASSDVILCNMVDTFTSVTVSPPSSPPGSPRSRSPQPQCLPLVIQEDVLVQTLNTTPSIAGVFSSLLQRNETYRKSFCYSCSQGGRKSRSRDLLFKIALSKPHIDTIDLASNQICSKTLWEYIELDDALHWLSTLGGAFSNLGEHNQSFAVRAGENAAKQLMVAHKFGDKTVIAKCWLFIAMSEMQQKHFVASRRIIKRVYKLTQTSAMKNLSGTEKIVTICRGIWARLVYETDRHKTSSKEVNIEVECKFSVPCDYTHRLLSTGAVHKQTKSMHDVYVDQPGFKLIRQNIWLRFREGSIELKYPDEKAMTSSSLSTVFREETDVDVINKLLGVKPPTSISDPEWIVLTHIKTKREIWALGNIEIVIDKLEDGFTLGEIEVVAHSYSQVAEANSAITDLADKLGFTQQLEGKLDHCLRSQQPEIAPILDALHAKRGNS